MVQALDGGADFHGAAAFEGSRSNRGADWLFAAAGGQGPSSRGGKAEQGGQTDELAPAYFILPQGIACGRDGRVDFSE